MTLPTLAPVYARGLLALLLAASSFGGGWMVRGWREAKADLKTERTDQQTVAAENRRRRAIGAQHARDQQQIEVFYDALPNWWQLFVAERPALADCELGPDGLREWNRWNEGPAAGADRRGAAAESPAVPATGRERPDAGSGR